MSDAPGTIVWVDIPVRDLDRAIAFYGAVLGVTVAKQAFPGGALGVLPHDRGTGGCLVPGTPSTDGPLIYLGCPGRLDEAERAVTPHGGRVLQAKHAIPPHGSRVVALDSEGNRIALHAR